MMKPRVMHRGLDGLPDIADGDVPGEFDHLVFVVHGIGSACDMKFQSVVGATNTVRDMVNDMSERHFSYAHMVRSQGPPLRRLTLETSQLGIYAQLSIYLLSPPQR